MLTQFTFVAVPSRFVDNSPSPVDAHRPSVRNPLATCNAALNRGPVPAGPVKCFPGKTVGRRLARSDSHLVRAPRPTPKEVEYVWKMVTLKWYALSVDLSCCTNVFKMLNILRNVYCILMHSTVQACPFKSSLSQVNQLYSGRYDGI